MGKMMLYCGVVVALAAGAAGAAWFYEGQWPITTPTGIDVNPLNGYVYVGDWQDRHICYYTSAGSYLGSWGHIGYGNGGFCQLYGIACAPNGWVYASNACEIDQGYLQYFTPAGSFLGQWPEWYNALIACDVAPNADVWAADANHNRVKHWTPAGSLLASWHPKFAYAGGIAVADAGNVYVSDLTGNLVRYFTAAGTPLGQWGHSGAGNGEFTGPFGVTVAADGTVYVVDRGNNRVQYFTASGVFLGEFGSIGTGDGQFERPHDVAFSLGGSRLYVTDFDNDRVQYFYRDDTAVQPASLGRVKALFR